jgi:4-amino-4-deoxy-L-arabinose transferase-like glycosyltransferase
VRDQSSGRQAAASHAAPAPFSPAQAAWAWARQWEFWLALALAIFLRFWRLDLTQYLDDQTRLMTLARLSVTRGLIPLTGIPSSIHTLNPPLSIYLLLPFAAFTANPMLVAISVALWNVIGVALCYVVTLRYFGRRVAAVSALLFATCGGAINYSRFIWQQNYLPPLLILWALTLFLGCVEGRRRWFAGNVILLALAALLHPTSALLAPVTLVGVALAPRLPRLRAWMIAALALLALALPTLVWEALSGFSDLHALRTYATGHSQINLTVLYYLYLAIGGGPAAGHGLSGGLSGGVFTALDVLAAVLFAAGWLSLSARLLRPARALVWRRESGFWIAARSWSLDLFRGLRADATWRLNLLLWLSVTLPPFLMLRHTGGLFAHYLMVLYPTAFIVSAIGAVDAIRWLAAWVELRGSKMAPTVGLLLESALLVFILARAGQWMTYPPTLTNASTFNAYHDYGYPLSVLQGGADTLAQAQARTGAAQVEVITSSDPRYRLPEDYILAGERSDRISLTGNCLALPAAASPGWLVAPVIPGSHAETVLSQLSNTEQVGSLPMVGGPAYPIYQVSGEEPLLAGERLVTPTVFDDHQGDSLRLLGASIPQPGALLLRWQVAAASAPADQTRLFRVVASVGGASAYADCEAHHWQAGETLFTWVPLRADGASDITVRVQTTANGLQMPHALGLRFLADAPIPAPLQPTTATVAPADPLHATVTASADGSLTIPAQTLAPAA